MSGKWVLGLVALLAVAATAATATAVFGGDSPSRPDYATVDVKMDGGASGAGLSARKTAKKKAKKPTVIYLQGEPSTVDVSTTGPYVDVRLFACPGSSRVLDGGVFPADTNVYQQGTYIPNSKEYHVLIGFDDGATPGDFQITSHLVCIKGVK